MKRKERTHVQAIGSRTFEQLVTIGIVFLLAPYIQKQLAPLREKLYPTDPNLGPAVIPVPEVAGTSNSQTVVGQTPNNTLLNVSSPLAPTGDQPAPAANAPALAPNAGPLGGLFLGN